jgi:hypothetical protein
LLSSHKHKLFASGSKMMAIHDSSVKATYVCRAMKHMI